MRRNTLCLIAAIAVGLPILGAEPSRDRSKKIVPALGKNQVLPGPKWGPAIANPRIATPFLSIVRLTTSRSLDMKRASLELTLHNSNIKPVTQALYIFEHWKGNRWNVVGQGLVSVNGRAWATVWFDMPADVTVPNYFRVRMPQSVEGAKQATLAATLPLGGSR